MRLKALDPLFRPRSIALIGADRLPRSVGEVIARNLFSGRFEGPVLPVHASLPAVRGVLTFRSIGDLPVVPDLAVVASPADTVANAIGELGERGTRMAIVLSAGFDTADRSLTDGLRATATAAGVRIVGPACMGIMVPSIGLNATYAHAEPKQGDIALVCQSGSLASILLDSPAASDAGFSLVASLGDMIDVDFGDILDFLALDPATRSVLLAVDHIDDARRFMSAARMIARIKPVIVFDAGRRDARRADAPAAAISRDRVYDAAFRRAGMLPVPLLSDLIAAAGTLAAATRVRGNRLAIVCNGGGIGRVTMQLWEATGGQRATLSDATRQVLDAALPVGWAGRNPVNVFADAGAERYRTAVAALFADPTADIVIVIVCPTAIGETLAAVPAIIEALPPGSRRKPLAVVWLDDASRDAAADLFTRHRVAVHPSVRWAVTAFAQLRTYQRNQEMLIETPASVPDLFTCDVRRAQAVIDEALAAGRRWLSAAEAETVLAAYDLPLLPAVPAGSEDEAVAVADALGYPVALRLTDSDSNEGGGVGSVALDLEDAVAVRAAVHRLTRRAREFRPAEDPVRFAVSALTGKADSHALRLGTSTDPVFGPVLRFGRGGNLIDGFTDDAIGLPPLNLALARTLMAETRLWWELQGAGDHPPASIEEAALAVVRVSQIIADLPQVRELEINPLLADADGVAALAVRIRVAAVEENSAAMRLAIRPYPVELEKTITTRTGKALLLRPIRPEDEPALQAFVRQMSSEDVRLRFFSSLMELDHRIAARLTQIDYDREMALVAIDPDAPSTDASIWGVMRISADASGSSAEYAGSVRSDLQGQGLGRLLMEEIIDCARRRGVREIWGEVLSENQGMLILARKLGFQLHRDPDDPGVIHVTKLLEGSS